MQNSSQRLQHLLRHVADSHRRRVTAALLVGYTMKPSRERNLASRGLLPLTAPHGVCFVPVDFGRPLEQQGPFDVMLHKVKPNFKPCLNLFVTIIPLSMCPCLVENHVRSLAIASATDLHAQFVAMTCMLATPSAAVCNV